MNSASDSPPFQCHIYGHWGIKPVFRVTASRAAAMALLSRTLLVHTTPAPSRLMYSTKEDPPGKSSQVWWVPLWSHYQAPMANQFSQQPRIYQGGQRHWRICISWPDGVHHSRLRYRAATIFLYHHSYLAYVHLQRGFSLEDTVDAKKAFEACAWIAVWGSIIIPGT